MGVKKWSKTLNCLQTPTLDDDDNDHSNLTVVPYDTRRASDVGVARSPTTPPSRGLLRSIFSSKRQTCEICSYKMIPRQGSAIFNAECSHSFHFACITTNLKHGNRICPVCQAQWSQIPFQSRTSDPCEKLTGNLVSWNRDDPWMASLQQQPLPQPTVSFITEPEVYDDDDVIGQLQEPEPCTLKMTTYPELPAVPKSTTFENFAVLIYLKAPSPLGYSRPPVDLVVVVDVSASMEGNKLFKLKRDLLDVIRNMMGPNDRLSVIAFSSTARRLFPLRRMTDTEKSQAEDTIRLLSANGSTNIAEGLRKGFKVMIDRRLKNPSSRIILLSDGRDTYNTVTGTPGYWSLFPTSIQYIPMHTFGYGADHDASSMQQISQNYGGMYTGHLVSDGAKKEAFVQIMGGQLNTAAEDVTVLIEGNQVREFTVWRSDHVWLPRDDRTARLGFHDLFAGEETCFFSLVKVSVSSADTTLLFEVYGFYREPLTKEIINLKKIEVTIDRPETMGSSPLVVPIEVDREQNRVKAEVAMCNAERAAIRGDLTGAVSFLESFLEKFSASRSAQAGDPMSVSLGVKLREVLERMSSRRDYEASERAYVLSGLSSYSWKRATTENATSSTDISQAYHTTSTTRSQTRVLGNVLPC